MKNTIFVIIMLGSLMLKAQDKVDKIMFMYIDGKYADCAFKAGKLSENSQYHHNSRVYLYLSMANYKLSKQKGSEDKYKHAFKDALKYAYKFTKYDKKYYKSKNIPKNQTYLNLLADSAIKLSQVMADNKNYYKASYYMGKLQEVMPDNPVVALLAGAYQIKAHDMSDGLSNVKKAFKTINISYKPPKGEEQALFEGIAQYNEIITSGKFDQYFKMYQYDIDASKKEKVLKMKDAFKDLVPKEEHKAREQRRQDAQIVYKKFVSQSDTTTTDK